MDPDFIRELVVLAAFVLLYVVGSAMLLRGHMADLSTVAATGTRRAMTRSGEGEQRLNRRRKAQARDAAAQGKGDEGRETAAGPED